MEYRQVVRILAAVGECHHSLRSLANRLTTTDSVVRVTHWVDMPLLEGAFRIEEYVDAEHSNAVT